MYICICVYNQPRPILHTIDHIEPVNSYIDIHFLTWDMGYWNVKFIHTLSCRFRNECGMRYTNTCRKRKMLAQNDGWPVSQQWSVCVCVFVQTEQNDIRKRAIVIKNSQRSRFSRTIESQTMGKEPIVQSKSNPWYLIFVPFFDKQRQKNVIFHDAAVARGPNS